MEEVEKEAKTSETEDEANSDKDQDVVFIQDIGFTVKVVAPSVEAFEIQVTDTGQISFLISVQIASTEGV